MLRDTHYLPSARCQNDPAHFRIADMKIERCVVAEIAARWDALARVQQFGWPACAILFGGLFISQMKRQRRLNERNVC
ncbi:hypothetical protein U1738_19380 [Sphingomonas sp. GB1N7]